MKFTFSWLKKHLDTAATLEQICDKLTALGLEVEGVEDAGKALEPFTVAYVKEAKQHPNADKLRVCLLETKFGDVQVVCGAPNARTGMKAIFAPEGSTIPATGTVLKAGELRGEKSCGMMVSEREMGLSDEHKGIIEVPDHFAIGTPLPTVLGLGDPVIEIKLTPNRADCAGVRGIARDLAAAGMGQLKALPVPTIAGSFPCPVKVEIADSTACPLFIGRVIKGVKNRPSPAWLQEALKAIGLRPISALVDITNYFTYDLCRPLHVFDLNKLQGDTLTIRSAHTGETLEALDNKTYNLAEGMTVIADAAGAQALGGVMGGLATGCTEDTTDVLLEVALFDPVLTAKTGRVLSINSDARYRFERGLDPAFVHDATALATEMILSLCGGEASTLVQSGSVPNVTRHYELNPTRTATLGGLAVEWAEQVRILETLGFKVEGQRVTPPSFRGDIIGEADLVEEILRVVGFDAIPTAPLPRVRDVAVKAMSATQKRIAQARRTLAARGLMETIGYSFVSPKEAALFGGQAESLIVANPISQEMSVLRPSALINLITAAARNSDRGFADGGLFEVGHIFSPAEKEGEANVLAMLRYGEAVKRQPQKGERMVDVFDAKADALAALEALGVPTAGLQVSLDAPAHYHPTRSGCLRLGANILATFGEIHPSVREALGLKTVAVGCEVMADKIPTPRAAKGTAKPLLKLSPFQPVNRDFAFVVANDVPADKLIKAIKGAEKDLITAVQLFDDYRGKGVPEGQKSLALGVTLQPQEKTLTEAEIEQTSQKIIAAVVKIGGSLRQ